MLDEESLKKLEQNVQEMRGLQHQLEGRLREAEEEVETLRIEIKALDTAAAQTEQTIDSLLLVARSGSRTMRERSSAVSDDTLHFRQSRRIHTPDHSDRREVQSENFRHTAPIAYIHQNRGIPSITNDPRPISNRFSDRTITQACRLLLREAGSPLHVNELYNMLVSGGMQFRGNNPTISIAVSLNRNRQFRKVDPGTFDLVMREAIQAVS